MLGKKKREEEEIRAFLGKGAEFTGKLMFNGSVRIDGDSRAASSAMARWSSAKAPRSRPISAWTAS